MKKNNVRRLTVAALFAALCFSATLFLKIPFLNGYIHLGDCFVLLAGWLLGPLYASLAAGIGSALADLVAGYPVYIPATFILKAAMACLACFMCGIDASALRRILSAFFAEALMVAGYFLYEWALYGIGGALPAVTGNLIQAAGGIATSLLLWQVLAPILKKHDFKF